MNGCEFVSTILQTFHGMHPFFAAIFNNNSTIQPNAILSGAFWCCMEMCCSTSACTQQNCHHIEPNSVPITFANEFSVLTPSHIQRNNVLVEFSFILACDSIALNEATFYCVRWHHIASFSGI